jgi:hypothetical protein
MYVLTAKNGDSYIVYTRRKSKHPFPILRYASEQNKTAEVLISKEQSFPKEWEPYIDPPSPQSLVVCFAHLPLKLLEAYIKECARG